MKGEWKVGDITITADAVEGTKVVTIIQDKEGGPARWVVVPADDLMDFISALMSADAAVNDQPDHVNPKWLPSRRAISRETVLPEIGGPHKYHSKEKSSAAAVEST